jgi:hypothetical protein
MGTGFCSGPRMPLPDSAAGASSTHTSYWKRLAWWAGAYGSKRRGTVFSRRSSMPPSSLPVTIVTAST